MKPLQDQMVQILFSGGSLRIRASGMTISQLVQLAASAKGHARLTIAMDTSLTQLDMLQIAANGGGAVEFDFAV